MKTEISKLTPISKEEFNNEVELLNSNLIDDLSENLRKILITSEKLKNRKESEIRFSAPVLKQNEYSVFFPHTINVIQGQAGVHKSRLVENICSALLKLPYHKNELLGFTRTNIEANTTVVYVDTERNLSEQFPYAIQSILVNAGYKKEDNPSNFKYISLLEISRQERFNVLKEYIKYLKKSTVNPMFIVLDVSTDCIEDFNRTDKSMELIDLMNIAINDFDVIFLCLIHENPGSEKARGHFGTELMNKASTAIQIGFEKDANKNNTEIIRLKYLKCRTTKTLLPVYIKYCEEKKGLVLANSSEIENLTNLKRQKANDEDLKKSILFYLSDGEKLSRQELINNLVSELGASKRTIEERLKNIIDLNFIFTDNNLQNFHLVKAKEGKNVIYYLEATF